MAIFDIIEDVSKKQIEKTETGDSRIMGVMLGKVVKNYDDNIPGRVSVILLSREEGDSGGSGAGGGAGGAGGGSQGGKGESADTSRLLWARVAQPSSGSSWGHYFIPEVGDLVLVTFEQGNIERPYIVGCIPKVKDKILTESRHKNNQFKKIVTKNGNSIIFEDVTEGEQKEGGQGNKKDEGKKDKITIKTAADIHHLLLDNEHNMIEISDKEKKNFIRLSTEKEKGAIEVTAEKNLTIKVGKNITLELNGDSGEVTLKASKLQTNISGETELTSKGSMTVKGSNATIQGSSDVKVSSSGVVSVSGMPIKLG